jgi:hypothetical protein
MGVTTAMWRPDSIRLRPWRARVASGQAADVLKATLHSLAGRPLTQSRAAMARMSFRDKGPLT